MLGRRCLTAPTKPEKIWVRISCSIDRIHKWWLSNYSFVFLLINLTSLVSMNKIERNFCFKVRLERMISTKTKE